MRVKSFPYPWCGPAGGYYIAYFDLELKTGMKVHGYRLDHVRDEETGKEVKLSAEVLEEITDLFAGELDDPRLLNDVKQFVEYGDVF